MKKFLKILGLLLLVTLFVAIYLNYPRLNIVSGYSAKNMSTSVFMAGRSFEFTDDTDNNFSPVDIAKDKIDTDKKTASASVYGFVERTAMFRDGVGSVLLIDDEDATKPYLKPNRNFVKVELPYPYGHLEPKDSIFENVDYNTLEIAIDSAFSDDKQTRAVLVLYKDHLIAERYADGFDKNSIILGWSMTKSITSTVYGILQNQGKLSVNDKAQVASWQNDERKDITLNDLLHMNSGLEWVEDYNTISDVTQMLFMEKDMAKVQEDKELKFKPNTHWNYSSGTSNLLSGLLKGYFGSQQEYLDFWYTDFIDKIGMHSMVVETDLEGNYVGSSYAWATPRDWAKFGLLYLHRGNWNGTQIFDETWVDYITTPTETSDGQYGGHFWLNAGGVYPDAPKDLFSANGYQGQRVFIIPSKDLVIVRMGLSEEPVFDFNTFLKGVLEAVN
jgi:CubicO group peptidase (beta-lactamase class C family)